MFRTAGIVRVCGIIDSNQRHKNVCKRIDEKRFESKCFLPLFFFSSPVTDFLSIFGKIVLKSRLIWGKDFESIKRAIFQMVPSRW